MIHRSYDSLQEAGIAHTQLLLLSVRSSTKPALLLAVVEQVRADLRGLTDAVVINRTIVQCSREIVLRSQQLHEVVSGQVLVMGMRA